MKINISKNLMALMLIATLIGGMTLAKVSGIWSDADGLTKAVEQAKKEASKEVISSNSNTTTTTEEVKISISVSEIKGSSTFEQVAEAYNVKLDDLINSFSLDKKVAADAKLKDLSTIFGADDEAEGGIGPASVRYFVAIYIGQDYERDDEFLPAAAVNLLKSLNKLSQEQIEYFNTHTVTK